jgi:hypothetical protein
MNFYNVNRSSGESMAKACLVALEEWNMKTKVQGLVFDTTASNTGLHRGACTLLEKALGTNLVWIACRHHIYEVVLSDVFSTAFGSSSGPEVGLFIRFQNKWESIDKTKFTPASEALFTSEALLQRRQQLQVYYQGAMQQQQPRDDYMELLNMCVVFLGGPDKSSVKFRAPGATNHARWMAKAIYCLKLYMFQDQFKLTKSEQAAVTNISLFVSMVYSEFWNEVPLAHKAPLNDLRFLRSIQSFPVRAVAETASRSMKRHLWYLSEHLVGLSFFDQRLENDTKIAMVHNLKRNPSVDSLKRLDGATFNPDDPIEEYVTQRSGKIFDLLINHGQDKAASFLAKQPRDWMSDAIYIDMLDRVKHLRVVNDCSERAIALIQTFNCSITKDENQKQYLLQLVEQHRKEYPHYTKAVLAKMNKTDVND